MKLDQSKIDKDPYTTELLQARFKRPQSGKPKNLKKILLISIQQLERYKTMWTQVFQKDILHFLV